MGRVGRETKGRRGKGATTISDLPLDEKRLLELVTRRSDWVLAERSRVGGSRSKAIIGIESLPNLRDWATE